MALLRLFWLSLLGLAVSQDQVCYSSGDGSDETCEGSSNSNGDVHEHGSIAALIKWVEEKGGYFNPKVEVRAVLVNQTIEDGDETGGDEKQPFSFGLFVKDNESISKGERILFLPGETIIYLESKAMLDTDNACLLADELVTERGLHNDETNDSESTYGPYIDFLEEYVIGRVSLPGSWSPDAKDLLNRIADLDTFASFVPYYRCFLFDVTGDVEYNFGMTELENSEHSRFWDQHVEVALSRRRLDNLLIPIYDNIQHSNNPKKINIVSDVDGDDNSVEVHASRDIQPNEEIMHSYGLGKPEYNHWFGFMDYGMSTMEMLRDFGFVEPYPQRWFYSEHALDFSIREVEGQDATGAEESLELVWLSDSHPDDDAIYTMERQLEELEIIKAELEELPTSLETKTLHDFLSAYIKAVKMAREASLSLRDSNESEYLLQEETVTIDNMDNHLFQIYQTNTLIQRVFDDDFEKIEELQSTYQTIEYYKDRGTKDRCLYLDNIYQQCLSYWSHYHELVVHKSAKYVKEDLKRVLWVGGGDSGPLNEILKYPSLELAVGLELDQQVTRLSFKHSAARPHYDNPKVQWWYGDASKSLLMLPKEYFGSFDLVIVDLSDTVFSLSVSEELDVIEAISLLLRPEGIFEMNELFMKKVSNVFEYSVLYSFHDIPKIHDQSGVIASNDVDFMFHHLTEHQLVENATLLVEQDSMKTKHRFDTIHDYRHNPNPAFKKLCKKMEEGEKKDKQQVVAPGIMMIVEAENLSADLSSPTTVRSAIVAVIEELGLHVVEDSGAAAADGSRFFIMMNEGYVFVRIYAEAKYCALDIHLWSAFSIHDALKEGIVLKALGGSLGNKSTSSYRIVAGGMFGLPNWKETSETHGPQISAICSEEKPPLRDSPSDDSVYDQALEMSLDAIQGEDLTAVVLCNATKVENDHRECQSWRTLQRHPKVKKVIAIYPCIMDEGHSIPEDEIEESMLSCTLEWAGEVLDEKLPDDDSDGDGIVNLVVLDPDVPEFVSEVLNIMADDDRVDPNNFSVIGSVDKKSELWKRKFIENVRNGFIMFDPVFRAHILLNTTKSSLELSIVSSGDELFLENLSKAVATSQEKSNVVTLEIRNIIGGLWREFREDVCDDEDFSQVGTIDDYQNDDATAQWNSQTPVATQSVARYVNQATAATATGADTGQLVVVLEDPEKLVQVCKAALDARQSEIVKVYRSEQQAEGDGLVCVGIWSDGTAVVSWDGRSQVDFNIWSDHDYADVLALEQEMVKGLQGTTTSNTTTSSSSRLVEGLRDFQPRGYGRVVNFRKDLTSKDTFFNQNKS